jgi:hypothetical protein
MSKQLKCLLTLITLVFTTTAWSAQSCTVTEKYTDYSSNNGSSNTASVTANINAVGDLVAVGAWCASSCTPVSVVLGSKSAVQTSVSGTASSITGQGFLFYILSASASGSQTLTWTVSGTHTDIQVSYVDFTPSAGCTFTHDVDSAVGTGTGTAINTPSITPSGAGELLFDYTYVAQHITAVDSPWSCSNFSGSGETQTCFAVTTFNTIGYILSGAAGSTANNMTNLDSGDNWQALITSFSISPGGPDPPTGLAATVH